MLEDTQVALIDLEKVTFYFQQFEGEPLVASMFEFSAHLYLELHRCCCISFCHSNCFLSTCRHASIISSGGHTSEFKGVLLPRELLLLPAASQTEKWRGAQDLPSSFYTRYTSILVLHFCPWLLCQKNKNKTKYHRLFLKVHHYRCL